MPVRILEETLVNQIAAGEVVERPASVVKELVENALDASALQVRVTLGAGGRDLVMVTDDGEGMDRADALMCLERHATSKITVADDLFRIGTLGFRGEAIPSIASVSRFTLTTRRHDADMGTRIRVEGGRLLDVTPAGAAPGTEIAVRDLFHNVPARRKFLRSADTELGHCQEAVTREALIRPDVDWQLLHDGRLLFHAPPTEDWRQRAADLLGPHGEALVPADFARGTLEVRGLVSPVGVHRQSASGTSWLYVNGRFVRDPVLRRAVQAAYAGIVPKDRHPVVILDVRLPAHEVDVNVHPAKTEVRFSDPGPLQAAISAGLRASLQEQGIRRPVAVEGRYRPADDAPTPVVPTSRTVPDVPPEPTVPARETAPRQATLGIRVPTAHPASVPVEPARSASPAVVSTDRSWDRGGSAPPVTPPPAAPARPVEARPSGPAPGRAEPLLPVPRYQDLRVLAQHANTYILCEARGELVLVDQHAAHERVNLVRLERDPAAALGPSQQLLNPVMVELPAGRARVLAERVEHLARVGLDVRPMGGSTFAVQGVPSALARTHLPTLLADLADEAAEQVHGMAVAGPVERVLATMACHGSVKAGQELTHHEMRALLVALDEVDFGVCAHGRPVAIRIGAAELERRFHRT